MNDNKTFKKYEFVYKCFFKDCNKFYIHSVLFTKHLYSFPHEIQFKSIKKSIKCPMKDCSSTGLKFFDECIIKKHLSKFINNDLVNTWTKDIRRLLFSIKQTYHEFCLNYLIDDYSFKNEIELELDGLQIYDEKIIRIINKLIPNQTIYRRKKNECFLDNCKFKLKCGNKSKIEKHYAEPHHLTKLLYKRRKKILKTREEKYLIKLTKYIKNKTTGNTLIIKNIFTHCGIINDEIITIRFYI